MCSHSRLEENAVRFSYLTRCVFYTSFYKTSLFPFSNKLFSQGTGVFWSLHRTYLNEDQQLRSSSSHSPNSQTPLENQPFTTHYTACLGGCCAANVIKYFLKSVANVTISIHPDMTESAINNRDCTMSHGNATITAFPMFDVYFLNCPPVFLHVLQLHILATVKIVCRYMFGGGVSVVCL